MLFCRPRGWVDTCEISSLGMLYGTAMIQSVKKLAKIVNFINLEYEMKIPSLKKLTIFASFLTDCIIAVPYNIPKLEISQVSTQPLGLQNSI
jgi:hypothetical protein